VTTEGGNDDGTGAGTRPRRWVLAAVALVLVAVAGGAVTLAVQASDDDGDDGAAPVEERLDIAVVGDSLIEQSRPQLLAHAEDQGLTVEAVAFGGSAPCDWMDDFERFADARPRQLIISFAGNDNTPCIHPGGGPPRDPTTIAQAYAATVPEILDLFAGTGTEVYLVVPPPVGAPASEPAAAAIRTVYRDLAAEHADVAVIDPAPLLSPDGQFHLTQPCEAWDSAACAPDGTVAVRNPDGIHLVPAGGERYARTLLESIGHPVDD
jgi:hypothetical protein